LRYYNVIKNDIFKDTLKDIDALCWEFLDMTNEKAQRLCERRKFLFSLKNEDFFEPSKQNIELNTEFQLFIKTFMTKIDDKKYLILNF
jgi:hypothetical protein